METNNKETMYAIGFPVPIPSPNDKQSFAFLYGPTPNEKEMLKFIPDIPEGVISVYIIKLIPDKIKIGFYETKFFKEEIIWELKNNKWEKFISKYPKR